MKKEIKFFVSVVTLVGIIITLFFSNISAMKPLSIDEQVINAQQKLETAENELFTKNARLFLAYKHNQCSDIGGQAETKLREKYPKEYWEYIEARAKLDDLRYIQFLTLVNGGAK